MWKPARFLRNLCALSFVAFFISPTINSMLGGFTAVALLLFGPVGLSAMREGARFANAYGRRPQNADSWFISRSMAECYLTFCVILSGLVALADAEFRGWLALSSLIGIIALYGVATSIAFVVIRWSYAFGVSVTLERRNNNAG